jgi:hypothetical protein
MHRFTRRALAVGVVLIVLDVLGALLLLYMGIRQ